MTETTDPLDTHGMTMDGEPAMPILVAEYNALIGRVNEAEARASVPSAPADGADLRRELASSERIRENADFHLGQEMARRQLAEKETARLRAVVARLRQMTDYWEQQLPEVIRTPAVVSAIRAALEAADEPSRMAGEAQQPETQGEVAYRSPGTRTLYCLTCARQESGWQPVTAPEVRDTSVCDFCGGRVLVVASRTVGDVVARYMPAPADRAALRETQGEVARLRGELAQAVEHRDYWHQEAMSATARIVELEPATPSQPAEARQADTAGERCVCGAPIEWMDVDVANGSGWIHSPGSDTPCLDARLA